MSLVTIHTRQAFEFKHDGKSITVPVGYTVLPSKAFDSFRATEFFNTLVEEGLLEVNVEPKLKQIDKQAIASKKHRAEQIYGPENLAEVVTVNGEHHLRLTEKGKVLPEVYKTADDATRAMLAYNRAEWRSWQKLNPTKQAS